MLPDLLSSFSSPPFQPTSDALSPRLTFTQMMQLVITGETKASNEVDSNILEQGTLAQQ